MTPEQKLYSVFEHLLLNTHGPHSNLDVAQLTARVTELSPNTMGWAKYLPEFMHAVTTLASMKQRVPSTNEVIRGPKPAPNPVPHHQPLTGDAAQDHIILRNHYAATLTEQERVDKAWLQAARLSAKERPPPLGEDRQPHDHHQQDLRRLPRAPHLDMGHHLRQAQGGSG